MKKILLLLSLCVLGGTALATETSNSAPVKIQAEIISDNIMISDINGRPILLDFGKISTAKKDGSSNAQVQFKVSVAGLSGSTTKSLTLKLGDENPVLKPTNLASSTTLTSKLGLDKTEGQVTDTKTEYRGFINGSIAATSSQSAAPGMYEGQSELTVTLSGDE